MKKFLWHIFAVFLVIISLFSCAPTKYSIELERRIEPEYNIDFGKTFPGIVAVSPLGEKDSVLLSQIAIGMAEHLEEHLGLKSGTIPLYSINEGDIYLADPESIDYLHDAVGTDILIIADSLKLGEFDVRNLEEKAYYENQFLNQIAVGLNYSLSLKVYKEGEDVFVANLPIDDKIEWLLYSDSAISDLKAINEVQERIEGSFKEAGKNAVSNFTPRWIKTVKKLFVYENDKWIDAYNYAYMFEWDKAMDIWIKEAKKSNSEKSACAAYNLSVACEVLGMEELAAEWKARYDKYINE